MLFVVIVAFIYGIVLVIGCILAPFGLIISIMEGDIKIFFMSLFTIGFGIFMYNKYKNTDVNEMSESTKELGLLDVVIFIFKTISEERALSKHSNPEIELYEKLHEDKEEIKQHSDWKTNIEIEVENQYLMKNELVDSNVKTKKVKRAEKKEIYNNNYDDVLKLYNKYKNDDRK